MYGEGRNLRYLVGFGLVILLLFVVIFMIVRGGGDSAKVPETKRELISYAEETNVTLTQTIIGPVTAAQNHDEIEIIVSNSSSVINLIKGYEGQVVNSASYPMSTTSFREFLSALQKAKFTEGKTDKELQDDTGYCSTGLRYVYEMYQGARQLQRFWATSCDGPKTYLGNLPLTLNLFESQIPDYDELTDDANLRTSNLGL